LRWRQLTLLLVIEDLLELWAPFLVIGIQSILCHHSSLHFGQFD